MPCQSTSCSNDRAANRARGQALVELLVVMAALLPAIVLIALFGKYQSVHWATIAASRELAFDCTVRDVLCRQADGGAGVGREMSRRMFAAADAPVHAHDDAAGGSFAPGAAGAGAPLWVDARNRPLHSPQDRLRVTIRRETLDAGLAVASRYRGDDIAVDARHAIGQGGPSRFGLQVGEGLLVAGAVSRIGAGAGAGPGSVPASGLSQRAPIDPLSLTFRAVTAIVADAWNASGPDLDEYSVRERVEQGRKLSPDVEAMRQRAYAPIGSYAESMRAAGLERSAPALAQEEPDPDLVPGDRLGDAR